MAAGLSKLFRPVAPTSVKSINGSSKKKAGGGKAGDSDGVSTTDTSKTDVQPAAQWAYDRQAGEAIPIQFRQHIFLVGEAEQERPGTSQQQHQQQEEQQESNANDVTPESQWPQLPGSIPDPDEKPQQEADRDEEDSVRQKTPPNEGNKRRTVLNGNAIDPEDIENVPQPSKQFVRDVRGKRVMKEFRAVLKLCNRPNSTFSIELVEDNLYEWNIKLFEVDQLSLLHYDMEKKGIPFLLFNMTFPDNFPFNPPFVRLVSPKIDNGYVMDGGAICMELLTPGGWSSAYTVEAIVMQLGATLVTGQARLARGKKYRLFGEVPFNKQEAMDSFKNIVETHKKYGWHRPAGDFS